MTPLRFCFAAALLLPLAGCKPDAALRQDAVIGRGTLPSKRPAAPAAQTSEIAGPTGAITGTILFSGKAPAPVAIDTSMDPACSLAGPQVFSEQYSVADGKLANVFVYVKQGPAAAMQAAPVLQAAVLDQKHCQYVPHVIGVFAGGVVEFRNDDPTMHNIHTMPAAIGNETIDISQGPKGAPVSKRFDKPELMIPVRCNNHPWMNAFINVSPTPFFAVTDAAGHFSLNGLPPGDYTLSAVHEKLGEKTVQVTVAANQTAKPELSFSVAH